MNNYGQIIAADAASTPIGAGIPLGADIDETVTVIVDMQPGFEAANDAITIWFIEQEIIRAKNENRPIVAVEFDPHEKGHTHPRLLALLEGYARAVVIDKWDDDGSARIVEACDRLGVPKSKFRAMGVNSDGCLLKTVTGLTGILPGCRITVVQDASNSTSGRDNPSWTKDFPSLPNVTVEAHGFHA